MAVERGGLEATSGDGPFDLRADGRVIVGADHEGSMKEPSQKPMENPLRGFCKGLCLCP